MLTTSFSSTAMFRATATRELCSWLTSVPGYVCCGVGLGGTLGNFEELSIPRPPSVGLIEGACKAAGGATFARGIGPRRDLNPRDL